MTIKIEDGIDDLTAVSLVKQVIKQGKISANGNSYCYLPYSVTSVWKQDNIGNRPVLGYIKNEL